MAEYEFEDHPYVVIEKRSSDLGSLILGIAIGAGIALLMAPKTGAETRRELKERARRVRDAAEGVAHDVVETVAETFDEAKDQVEERIDSARAQVEMRKDQVTHAIDAGRVAARQARADLERRIAETKASYQAQGRPGSESGSET